MCFRPLCALYFTVAETENFTISLRGRSGPKKTGPQGLCLVCVCLCPSCSLCFTVAETEESTVHLRGRSIPKKTGPQGLRLVCVCVCVCVCVSVLHVLCVLQLQRLRNLLLVLEEEVEPGRQDLKVC